MRLGITPLTVQLQRERTEGCFPCCVGKVASRQHQEKQKRASGALDPASLADNEHETTCGVPDLREMRAQ